MTEEQPPTVGIPGVIDGAPHGRPSSATERVPSSAKRPSAAVTTVALAVTILVVAELLVRLAAMVLPSPMQWYSAFADVKATQLQAARWSAHYTVVFLGDSSAMSALDPKLFSAIDGCHRLAYNAGVPGATPALIEHWLGDAVLPNVDPELVIIGTTSAVFARKPEVKSYLEAPAVLQGVGASVDRFASQYFYLIRYRRTLRDPGRLKAALDEGLRGVIPPWRRLDAYGFDSTGSMAPYTLEGFQNAREALQKFRVDDAELDSLTRIVWNLRERGSTVVVADLPVSADWVNFHPQGRADYLRYQDTLRNWGEKTGVAVVDLTQIGDRSVFVDPIHFNRAGSDLVTQLLASALPTTVCDASA